MMALELIARTPEGPYKKALEVLSELQVKQEQIRHQRNKPIFVKEDNHKDNVDRDLQLDLEIYHAIEKAIEIGPWQESNYLRATGKKLQELREQCKSGLHLEETIELRGSTPLTLVERIAKRHGLIEVYLYLYVAGGINVERWEDVLNTITGYSVSRPIYAQEKDAKAALRAASNITNEAYAVVYVRQDAIIQQDSEMIPRDRQGCELLVLKERAIALEHVLRFVHVSGQYIFEKGRLIRQGAAEIL